MLRAAASLSANSMLCGSALRLTSRRFQHIPISTPIGKGRVVKLVYDSNRPAYTAPHYATQWFVITFWNLSNLAPNMVIAFALIWAAHGGFSGVLPPDPHSLHH